MTLFWQAAGPILYLGFLALLGVGMQRWSDRKNRPPRK